jgi:hypothetical protein
MRHVYNDGGRKAAGYKGMPPIASLGPSPSPLAVAGSRKSPQWASLGAGGQVRSLPPPEMFS